MRNSREQVLRIPVADLSGYSSPESKYMSGPGTLRDEVWSAVLERLLSDPVFKSSELDVEATMRTRRDVLKAMEDEGWVERRSGQSHYWCAGPKSRAAFDLDEEDIGRVKSCLGP